MAVGMAHPDRAENRATIILVALLAVASGIALFHAGAGAFFRVPQNFNEGWNAYLARAAYEGALYFPDGAPVANNYPPLSFYLIGGLARLGGDPIYIGRALAAGALAVVALDIYAILRFFAVDRLMAASVAVAFLGFVAIGFPGYVATNDPQWLAHGVMTTALAAFLWGYPGRGAIVGSALAMLAAGLIKHNLLPIPLAVTVWLFLYDRPRFRLWVFACIAAAAPAAVIVWGLHGALAFKAIFLLKRQYLPIPFANALYEFVAPTVPLLVLFFLSGTIGDKCVRLIAVYAAAALLWDVYTMSAVGVASNGILDYLIAVALLTGLSLSRLLGSARLCALAMLVLPIAVVTSQLQKPHRVWQALERQEVAYAQDEALLRAYAGPVLCHSTALCFWAGKAFEYDPFNTVRKMKLFPAQRTRMVNKLNAKHFSILQIYKLGILPADVVKALNENYVQFRVSETGWVYYRRR